MPERMSKYDLILAADAERRRRWEEKIGDPYEYNQKVIKAYEEAMIARKKAICDNDPVLRFDPKTNEIRLASDMDREEGSAIATAVFIAICLIFMAVFLLVERFM